MSDIEIRGVDDMPDDLKQALLQKLTRGKTDTTENVFKNLIKDVLKEKIDKTIPDAKEQAAMLARHIESENAIKSFKVGDFVRLNANGRLRYSLPRETHLAQIVKIFDEPEYIADGKDRSGSSISTVHGMVALVQPAIPKDEVEFLKEKITFTVVEYMFDFRLLEKV